MKMKEMSYRVEKHMKSYAHVVPYPDLQEKHLELQMGLLPDLDSTDVCEELDHLSENITVERKISYWNGVILDPNSTAKEQGMVICSLTSIVYLI